MAQFTKTTTNEEVLKVLGGEVNGKTFVITGPTDGGLGAETALSIAPFKPEEIILVGRSEKKADPVIVKIKAIDPTIKVSFVEADLADSSSVRAAAKLINERAPKIDVLINNAGVMALKDYNKTVDGVELQLAANHLGHFLLTNLIIKNILAASPRGRIVNLTSDSYIMSGVRFDDWNFEDGKTYNAFLAYAQSKTANILFTKALAKRLEGKGVSVIAVNPGMVQGTNLAKHLDQEMSMEGYKLFVEAHGGVAPEFNVKAPETSVSTTLVAALDPALQGSSGAYLNNCAIESLTTSFLQGDNVEKLWVLSEQLVGEKFELL